MEVAEEEEVEVEDGDGDGDEAAAVAAEVEETSPTAMRLRALAKNVFGKILISIFPVFRFRESRLVFPRFFFLIK